VVVGALVINSVLSVPYYFGIVRNMLFEEPAGPVSSKDDSGALRFSVYVLAVATTLFGLLIIPLSTLVQSSGLL
jgi:NADH-quinone oxidoreductase subunit N